ncbi:MAG: SMP-30/gluconolactonase/LRE family protein, partial [Spirochaetaceae bacterium]
MVAAYESFVEGSGRFVPGSALLEKLYEGTKWAEGPVYFGDLEVLLWSDIPNDRMLRWTPDGSVTIYRQPANNSNGNTRDRSGRLITCEHGSRSVVRTEPDGSRTVLASHYNGKRLNSPNDVAVKSDGSVWFTDPTYGIVTDYEGNRADGEIGSCNVYRIDPESMEIAVVADDFVMPNGIAFSPDESVLYVSDTGRTERSDGPAHIRSFAVSQKGLTGGEVFADVGEWGLADGFRVDTEGNVWTSAGPGVNCYRSTGELVLRIPVPEAVANLTFGGPKRNRLFITAHTSLYSIYTGKTGALR